MLLPPSVLLTLVVLSNMLNYIDRGLIPGASNELQTFVEQSLGGSDSVAASTVQAWFGALVSAYIACYSIAAILFGQLARGEARPLRLVGSGLVVWCAAAVLCFAAGPAPGAEATLWNFCLLFGGRALSGVGEAGFQCIIPGLISEAAPAHQKAMWMAALYTPIPVGTAMGYMIGAKAAHSALGWRGAFAVEAALMLPIALLFCAADKPTLATDKEGSVREESGHLLPPNGASNGAQGGHHRGTNGSASLNGNTAAASASQGAVSADSDSSFVAGVRAVLSSCDFCLITLGYAAHTAVFAGLAAFGPALSLGLGFFRGREARSSLAFGAAVALGGAVGTPLGGYITDRAVAGRVQPAGEEPTSVDSRIADRRRYLWSMICFLTSAALVALCCVAAPSEVVFLPLISLSVLLAYGSQASIMMATLSCVVPDLQPMAMSLSTFGIHALGDVPSPVVIGLVKGTLAPHCTAVVAKDGASSIDPRCAEERLGLRVTLAVTVCYLFVAVLWWLFAWGRARRQARTSGTFKAAGESAYRQW